MPAKRFRLSMINAAEDVPRLIRAYGRACGGEFALVLRPREDRGLLVLIKQPPRRSKQPAEAWSWSSDKGFAPAMPTESIAPSDAVTAIKAEQKGTPKAGPITLRGQWSGYLYCDEQVPRVELRRKLATYAVLTITSSPTKGWSWAVERTEKWFSTPGTDTGAAKTLLKAIEGGLASAMGLLGEACSQRDSHRRSAFDTEWSKTHPIRPAREHKRNPLDRLKLKVPATKTALKKQAAAIKKDALAVKRDAASPAPSDASVASVTQFFHQGVIPGFLDLADRIHAYANGQLDTPLPVDDFIKGLRADVRARVKEDGRKTNDSYGQEALSWVDALETALKSAPSLLARTKGLIAYATAATDSPKCTGGEETEARKAIEQAQVAYDDARLAFVEGYERQAMRKLRQAAEWLGLSAARVAASCKAGQSSLTARIKRTPKKAPPPTPAPPAFSPQVFTHTIAKSGNKTAAFAAMQEAIRQKITSASVRDAVTFLPAKRGSWTLQIRAETQTAADQLTRILPELAQTTPAPSKRATRRRSTSSRSSGGGSGLSAEKNALLQQAFSTAIADVVRQLQAGA